VEDNIKGVGKRGAAVGGHEVTMAWTKDEGAAIAQATLRLPMRVQISEKRRGGEEEVFEYLGQMVTRKSVDWSVVLLKEGSEE